jgi:hypothetical protein
MPSYESQPWDPSNFLQLSGVSKAFETGCSQRFDAGINNSRLSLKTG